MIIIDSFIDQLEEKKRIMFWLIDGTGIHCLPLRYVDGLTKERIVQLYNIEIAYFIKKDNMTFEEFEAKYFKEVLDNKPKDIRPGQALMNYLHEVWPEKYNEISSMDNAELKENTDCFYNDRKIPACLKHLREKWEDFLKKGG